MSRCRRSAASHRAETALGPDHGARPDSHQEPPRVHQREGASWRWGGGLVVAWHRKRTTHKQRGKRAPNKPLHTSTACQSALPHRREGRTNSRARGSSYRICVFICVFVALVGRGSAASRNVSRSFSPVVLFLFVSFFPFSLFYLLFCSCLRHGKRHAIPQLAIMPQKPTAHGPRLGLGILETPLCSRVLW